MDSLTQERLAEIKARCEAATKQTPPCNHRGCYSHRSHPCEGCRRQGGYASQTQLIAIIRQDLPDCIAEIERLKGKAQAILDECHTNSDEQDTIYFVEEHRLYELIEGS